MHLICIQQLAAKVAGVGRRRIFVDPLHASVVANANSRRSVRKLIADNIIVVKPEGAHIVYKLGQRKI